MRLPDWQVRLVQYLGDCARKPYQPGSHDCALFAAGAVEAQTGTDFAAQFRGNYTTLEEGFNALREVGFDSHIDMAAAYLPEIDVAHASPGDLAVIPSPVGDVLGVLQGESVYVLTTERLGLWPRTGATRAFRVT